MAAHSQTTRNFGRTNGGFVDIKEVRIVKEHYPCRVNWNRVLRSSL